MEAMLRGLYQGIRNPRSHDAVQDTERDALALLIFIDYLLRIVDKSGSPFSLNAIVTRILDPDFVKSDRYATLVANEIPAKKRIAVCREVFARRHEADREKVGYFYIAILRQMPVEENAEFCEMLSGELRSTTDEETIRFVMGSIPVGVWPKIDEQARLRIETKLIASVKEGKWVQRLKRCTSGVLGTWITPVMREMTLKNDLWAAIVAKLDADDIAEQDYAFQYFVRYAPECLETPSWSLIQTVILGLAAGDERFRTVVRYWTWTTDLDTKPESDPWVKPFVDALARFVAGGEVAADSTATQDHSVPF